MKYSCSLERLIDLFLSYSVERGFLSKPKNGLISEYFRNDFTPSGGHQYVLPLLLAQEELVSIQKISIIETCFRRVDIEKLGYSTDHLLLFEMGVVGILGALEDKSERIYEIMNFLFDYLNIVGIAKGNIVFTISSGAEVLGTIFEEDKESYNALINLNVHESNIIKTIGRRNFMYSKEIDRPAGYSIEIFHGVNNHFVEIGSINIYTHIFKNGGLVKSANIAIGGGFGFERLSYVVDNKSNVFEIYVFIEFINSLSEFFAGDIDVRLLKERLNMIAELIRALSFIMADGQLPDKSGRGKIVKRLCKYLFSELSYLNLPTEDVVKRGVEVYSRLYFKRHPQIMEMTDVIIKAIQSQNPG